MSEQNHEKIAGNRADSADSTPSDLLVQLDKEPFEIAVAIKKAAVDTATAELAVAKANVRGIEAEAMSRRRALEHAIEDVDDQVALLRARVAGVDKSQA